MISTMTNIRNKPIEEIFQVYNHLNDDISHFSSRDDICTPMECVKQMVDYIPAELWFRQSIRVLDACCGNGNFGAYCALKTDINNIWFNDINLQRLQNCRQLLSPTHMLQTDILSMIDFNSWDLIISNPPYSGGGNKNKSLSNLIIRHCISLLKEDGYLCFVTPNNWMTYNSSNDTLHDLLTQGHFVVIDNDAKKYFPSVGSSFTIFVWQKNHKEEKTRVINSFLLKDEQSVHIPSTLKFIPLYISQDIISIIEKAVLPTRNLFDYRCDLHNFTQKEKLRDYQDETFCYETIHTVRKMRFSCMKQDIYDKWTIIVPLSTYYVPFIRHHVNVTQSVGYLSFDTLEEAQKELALLQQPWVKLLVHITRYGNFNNIMVLRHLDFNGKMNFTHRELNTIETLTKLIKY